MNLTILLNTLAIYLNDYFYEELDPSLKPKDSAACTTCRTMNYDFIIVGAGSAGCVLANRLSENPNWNVLLIEAGGDEDYITDIPALAGLFTGTKYDWNYTTVKQEAVCQDTDGYCQFPLGHVMGGSSTIGDMLYLRADSKHYDEWAELGNPGWSYKDVLPYFLKAENTTLPDPTVIANLPYHNSKGIMPIKQFNSGFQNVFVQAADEFGYKEIDNNGTYKVGMGFQLITKGGTRRSSSKAYLNPLRNRKNLHIFKNTLVTKVLLSDDSSRKAIGVGCVTGGKEYEVYSSKEVILSAGAINTPKLLMLSGIGPKKHLEDLGIPVYADLPVGQNLVDHPGILVQYRTNATELIYDDKSMNDAILDYAQKREGILTVPQFIAVGLDNITPNKKDERSELTILYFNGYSLPDLSFHNDIEYPHIKTNARLINTFSKGTVTLKSKSYSDPPLIDPKYLSNIEDYKHLLQLFDIVLTFYNLPNWARYAPELVNKPQCKHLNITSDEFKNCFIKYATQVGYFPTSTAKMGPVSDKTAVVDSNLKVHGVGNLRVVDASVIPKAIRGIPFATVEMIAEKASDFIRDIY